MATYRWPLVDYPRNDWQIVIVDTTFVRDIALVFTVDFWRSRVIPSHGTIFRHNFLWRKLNVFLSFLCLCQTLP